MHEITYHLTHGDQTVVLDVSYDVAAYDPGSTWGLPEDSEPPSGGEITELDIKFEGADFTLTVAERDALEQHIYSTHDYSDDSYDPDMDIGVRFDREWE